MIILAAMQVIFTLWVFRTVGQDVEKARSEGWEEGWDAGWDASLEAQRVAEILKNPIKRQIRETEKV